MGLGRRTSSLAATGEPRLRPRRPTCGAQPGRIGAPVHPLTPGPETSSPPPLGRPHPPPPEPTEQRLQSHLPSLNSPPSHQRQHPPLILIRQKPRLASSGLPRG